MEGYGILERRWQNRQRCNKVAGFQWTRAGSPSSRISSTRSLATSAKATLRVKNMSKSATKRVAQKSGLNRSLLDASPFELRRQQEYKTQRQGGLLVAVPPQNTSRKCPECGHVSVA